MESGSLMKLVFLGTRANNDPRSRHAALLVVDRGRAVMIDCGADWQGQVDGLRPNAIVVIQAHPDPIGAARRPVPRLCPRGILRECASGRRSPTTAGS